MGTHPRPLAWSLALAALIAGVVLLTACGDGDGAPSQATQPSATRPSATQPLAAQPRPALPEVRDERLRAVRSFAYQLQGAGVDDLDLGPLEGSDADLFIIDYSRDGSAERAFGRDEIASLQADGRIVLAYLSVGEAESYRDYWEATWAPDGQPGEDAPRWLGPTNPAWAGNYKVRYWDERWQAVVVEYLDRVIDAGFDGVFLDVIDAFEYFGPDGALPERDDAASLMVQLVARIAEHAREQRARPRFLVVPQNGAPIIELLGDEERERYFDAIDAIGAEDSFYFGARDEDNPLDVQGETLTQLRRFRRAGLLVLAVDYLTDATKVADFCARARAEGFVPLAAVRALDRLPPERCP